MKSNNKILNPFKMKSITPLSLIVALLMSILSYTSVAQNYDFTLIQNSDYNYTIAAEALFDSGSFQPITQSYGFVLVLPDGITITVDDVQPSGTNETVTAIPGTNVVGLDPTMVDKDLFQIITDTQGNTISAHTSGQIIPLVTLTVEGTPSSGEIRLLSNTSTLASHPALNGALDAFFQVDVTNDATVNFNNEFNKINDDEAFSFETLSIEIPETQITDLSLYPNPANDIVYIKGNTSLLHKVEIFNIVGQSVIVKYRAFDNIDISQLETAVYLVKLNTDNASKSIKLVKK